MLVWAEIRTSVMCEYTINSTHSFGICTKIIFVLLPWRLKLFLTLPAMMCYERVKDLQVIRNEVAMMSFKMVYT